MNDKEREELESALEDGIIIEIDECYALMAGFTEPLYITSDVDLIMTAKGIDEYDDNVWELIKFAGEVVASDTNTLNKFKLRHLGFLVAQRPDHGYLICTEMEVLNNIKQRNDVDHLLEFGLMSGFITKIDNISYPSNNGKPIYVSVGTLKLVNDKVERNKSQIISRPYISIHATLISLAISAKVALYSSDKNTVDFGSRLGDFTAINNKRKGVLILTKEEHEIANI